MALSKFSSFRKVDKEDFVLPAKGRFKGDLHIEGNARLNGKVAGDVFSELGDVICGPESLIEGTIQGVNISVFGNVFGDVSSRGQLSVFSGGRLEGNIIAGALLIEKGASFAGNVVVTKDEISTVKAPVAVLSETSFSKENALPSNETSESKY